MTTDTPTPAQRIVKALDAGLRTGDKAIQYKVSLADIGPKAAKRLVDLQMDARAAVREQTAERDRLKRALVSIAQHRQPCRHCDGTGIDRLAPLDACHECGGLGETLDATPALADPEVCEALTD